MVRTIEVGSYTTSPSANGTFDQAGNVWEMNEAIILGSSRGLRGGDWGIGPHDHAASRRNDLNPTAESGGIGLRVASVPEPSTALLFASGLVALAVRKRRRF